MSLRLHGVYDESKAGRSDGYFDLRDTTLDCRGDLMIDPKAEFGFNVKVYSLSHDISGPHLGPATVRKVHIERDAWICSEAILFNCIIGQGSVVSVGSVVASRVVPPHSIVEGNPAMLVARRDDQGKWQSVIPPEPLERMETTPLVIAASPV